MAVRPAVRLADHARLFASLEAAFNVRFVPWSLDSPPIDGVIVVGSGSVPTLAEAAVDGVPALALGDAFGRLGPAEDVRLGKHHAVDRRLWDVLLQRQSPGPALEPTTEEAVLAAARYEPAWTRGHRGAPIDRVRAALPQLSGDDVLWRLLGRGVAEDALGLVALVHFLRGVEQAPWVSEPPRAAFVFDDPNLRRPSYGYIDYEHLVRHADTHDYHAAMAMVPLDARASNPAAVATFRNRPDRLSLVIHGNNHVRRELMRARRERDALEMCSQALRRIARFEVDTGLRVDRVMMPPHGMCSRTVTRSLGALGYGALCAIHPCPWTEIPPPERLLAGWTPAEFVDGCAVIPRFSLSASATEIALRAFLDQPLVLYGHHGDLSTGLETLADAAGRVQRLGDVRWCSLQEIMLANYELSVRNRSVAVRPWAGVVRVTLPAGAAELRVELPSLGSGPGLKGWSRADLDLAPHALGLTVPLFGESDVVIRLHPNAEMDPRSVPDPPWRAWPRVRRRAAEARDRLAPATSYARVLRGP